MYLAAYSLINTLLLCETVCLQSIDPDRGEVDVTVAPKFVEEEDKFLLEGEALEQIDVFDDQYGVKTFKDMQGVNFEAVMEARMLDEVGFTNSALLLLWPSLFMAQASWLDVNYLQDGLSQNAALPFEIC